MYKISITLLCLLTAGIAVAQKKQDLSKHDTVAYYMLTDKQMAYGEKDAEFLRLIIKVDSGMFNIQDYYMDANPRLVAYSSVGDLNYDKGLNGPYLEYNKNGKRKSIKRYYNGKLTGAEVLYYPNGMPYNVKTYENDSVFYKSCYDSTGTVLAEKGKGKWLMFDRHFKTILEEGQIENGKPEGEWKGKNFDGTIANYTYKNGSIVLGAKGNENDIFEKVDVAPSFKGGDPKFDKYITHSLRYPAIARERKIQGRVVISFVVEKDGSLTDVKLKEGVHPSINEEALRIIKAMPLWNPGTIEGNPVRVQYSIPIKFALANIISS
jgi:TonB family protein